MSQYSWLIDKKREAMAAKLQQRGLPNYSQRPIRERYGVSYTGAGPDGQVDKSEPAGIAGAPGQQHIYHEGEMRAHMPEGDMYVNADTTQKMMMAPTDQDNMEMNMKKQTGNLPGYATGGFAPTKVSRQVLANTAQSLAGQISNHINDKMPGYATGGFSPNDSMADKNPVAMNYNPATGKMGTPTPINITQQAPVRKIPEVKPIQIAPVQAPETRTVEPVVRKAPEPQIIQFAPNLAGQTPKTDTTAKTAEDQARGAGLDYLQGTLTGKAGIQLEGQRAMDELSARQQQERSAAEQRAIQEGLSPDRARVESQILRDKQEQELNATAAKYGIAGMNEKAQTAANLASQGLAGQQFENEKTKYGDSADWKAYETAIAAGDFKTAAEAYKRVTGNDISMEQMQTNQRYLNTKQDQDIKTGDLNIQGLEQKLGAESWSSMQKMINDGADLTTINAKLTADGKPPLTLDQFNGIYNATSTADRNYNRDMGMVQTLLAAEDGSGKNSAQAAKLLNDAFPGTNIDFTGLVTTANSKTFNTGLAQMSDIVMSGSMDFNEAYDVLEGNGTFKMMGIDTKTPEGRRKAESIFNGLRINVIDEQFKTVTDSDWWNGTLKDEAGNLIPGPTPEEKGDFTTFMKAVLTGKLDYKIQKEYTVTAKDGTVSTMYFDSEEAANKFAVANKDSKIISTGQKKVVPQTNVTNPDGTKPESLPDISGLTPGQTTLKDGVPYVVDQTNKPIALKFDATNVWSQDNDKILEAGETGNNLYSKVVDARVKDIVDTKDFSSIKGMPVDSPIYKGIVTKMNESSTEELWSNFDTWRSEGTLVKVKDPITGEIVLAMPKATSSPDVKEGGAFGGKIDNVPVMQFETTDGRLLKIVKVNSSWTKQDYFNKWLKNNQGFVKE